MDIFIDACVAVCMDNVYLVTYHLLMAHSKNSWQEKLVNLFYSAKRIFS